MDTCKSEHNNLENWLQRNYRHIAVVVSTLGLFSCIGISALAHYSIQDNSNFDEDKRKGHILVKLPAGGSYTYDEFGSGHMSDVFIPCIPATDRIFWYVEGSSNMGSYRDVRLWNTGCD